MKNIKIEEKDIELINSIAKKYNMEIEEFTKVLEPVKKTKSVHIRCNKKEVEIIDKKADKLFSASRSGFLIMATQEYINDEKISFEDLQKINKLNKLYSVDGEVRDIKIHVSFSNIEDYRAIEDVAKKYKIKVASLIRYIGLVY